jgi:hypothetical protein
MMPKNPLDAILAEVLGDDGGLLLAGNWPAAEEPEDETLSAEDIVEEAGHLFVRRSG